MNQDLIGKFKPGTNQKKCLILERKQKEHRKYLPMVKKSLNKKKKYASLPPIYKPQIPQSLEIFEAYYKILQKDIKEIRQIEEQLGVCHNGLIRNSSSNYGFNFKKISANRLVLGNRFKDYYSKNEYQKMQNQKKVKVKRGQLLQISKTLNQ